MVSFISSHKLKKTDNIIRSKEKKTNNIIRSKEKKTDNIIRSKERQRTIYKTLLYTED